MRVCERGGGVRYRWEVACRVLSMLACVCFWMCACVCVCTYVCVHDAFTGFSGACHETAGGAAEAAEGGTSRWVAASGVLFFWWYCGCVLSAPDQIMHNLCLCHSKMLDNAKHLTVETVGWMAVVVPTSSCLTDVFLCVCMVTGIGDTALAARFEETGTRVKRDIVFAASLYL